MRTLSHAQNKIGPTAGILVYIKFGPRKGIAVAEGVDWTRKLLGFLRVRDLKCSTNSPSANYCCVFLFNQDEFQKD